MQQLNNRLQEKLVQIPEQPGIYRFIENSGTIIYIGKAKNLKNRVQSYFLKSNQDDPRTRIFVPAICDVEWVVTHSDADALVLEDHLIKLHKPKYNIKLKDNKSYPYFKLTVQETFPRLMLVRKIVNDGALYFGPYTAVTKIRETWKIIKKYFPLRQSKMPLDGSKLYRPCLNYQLKRCMAPCGGHINEKNYGEIVDSVRRFLKGNYAELIDYLKEKMTECSQKLAFEEAAQYRDQISVIQGVFTKQKKVDLRGIDQDVFALERNGGFAGVQILFIRNGFYLSDDFVVQKKAEQFDDAEILRSVLSKLYFSGEKPIPSEILLPIEYPDAEMLEDYALSKKNTHLKLLTPKRGERKLLMEMAQKNCQQNLTIHINNSKTDEIILSEVQQVLKLKRTPSHVECFDISNTSGTGIVASMVVWKNNHSANNEYRKYKIKSVTGPDDFQSMEEVLSRRFRMDEKRNSGLPDLILIDGGKGQISTAEKILTDLNVDLSNIDLIGLAKGRSEKKKGSIQTTEDYEYVVKPHQKNLIRLRKNSATLHFLQNIRDEAHRFAITYHRKVRSVNSLSSKLESISGIGEKKRKILLKEFRSLRKISQASLEELSSVKGISDHDAKEIQRFFKQD